MISPKHLNDVCCSSGYYTEKACRYLGLTIGCPSLVCLKLKPNMKNKIDEAVARIASGKPLDADMSTPFGNGDNCPGFPVLKRILQGYDIP